MIKLSDKGTIVLDSPKVISRAKSGYGIWLDTETCNYDKMIFDFSIKIINLKDGSIKKEYSFVILDCWETRHIIQGCFSKKKKKDYPKLLKSGKYHFITRKELVIFLNNLFKEYKIACVGAFNVEFDIQALYNTLTYVNKRTKYFKEPVIQDMSECAFFGTDMLDIWAYASIIFSSKEYKEWYKQKGYKLTKNGYLKTGVEMLSRYLKDNGKFVETHKGQDDLDNEYAIFVSSALLRNDKKLLVNVSGKQTLALARPTKTDKKSKQYITYVKQKISA